MSAGKIIGFIVSGLLIVFGALLILGSTSQNIQASGQTGIWIMIGLFFIAVGLVIIFFVARRPAQQQQDNVTLKIDLPGNVNMDTLKCKSCGGVLGPEDIKMVAGAPVVTCPWCHTTYQLTEDPKW